MTHPEWCGEKCAECSKLCDLDLRIPCYPDCCNFDNNGEPQALLCKDCDCYKNNYILDVRIEELDKEILLDVIKSYDNYIQDNIENNNEFGHGWFPVCIEEFFDNEYKNNIELHGVNISS